MKIKKSPSTQNTSTSTISACLSAGSSKPPARGYDQSPRNRRREDETVDGRVGKLGVNTSQFTVHKKRQFSISFQFTVIKHARTIPLEDRTLKFSAGVIRHCARLQQPALTTIVNQVILICDKYRQIMPKLIMPHQEPISKPRYLLLRKKQPRQNITIIIN